MSELNKRDLDQRIPMPCGSRYFLRAAERKTRVVQPTDSRFTFAA